MYSSPVASVPSFLNHLNNVNKHIQFTVEEEENGVLPFLDVLLTRNIDGTIETSVYRKQTHTDRYLDFSSHHPLSHKKSVVTSLLSRAKALSSAATECTKERLHVTGALKENSYPASFIWRAAPPLTPAPTQGIDDTDTEQAEKQTTVTLPYVQGLLEPIKRILEQLNVTVRMRPDTTLRKLLVRPKDPVPPELLNGVVYRIPCRDCDQAYVGQSGRSLSCRVKEHQRAFPNGDTNASALAEHAWKEGHYVDWQNAEVLEANQQYWRPRCLLESWHINKESKPMNRERGPLPEIYRSLLTSRTETNLMYAC